MPIDRPTLGEMLYSEYSRLREECNYSVDPWPLLDFDERQFWDTFATAIDFEPHDGICDRFAEMGRPYRS